MSPLLTLNEPVNVKDPVALLLAINVGLYIFIFYVNSRTINDGYTVYVLSIVFIPMANTSLVPSIFLPKP